MVDEFLIQRDSVNFNPDNMNPHEHNFGNETPTRGTRQNRPTFDPYNLGSGRPSHFEERVSSANNFTFKEKWDSANQFGTKTGSPQPKQAQRATVQDRFTNMFTTNSAVTPEKATMPAGKKTYY